MDGRDRVESQATTVVRLEDIDLLDRTFDIRRPGGTGCRRRSEARPLAIEEAALPVLWHHVVPYTILRGFRRLERMVALIESEAGYGTAREVEAVFLDDIEENPGVLQAMVVACTGRDPGRFSLKTRECARAIRRLRELGLGDVEVSEFLWLLNAPQRTGARARLVSNAPDDLWTPFDAGGTTLAYIEAGVRRRVAEDHRASAETTIPPAEPAEAALREQTEGMRELQGAIREKVAKAESAAHGKASPAYRGEGWRLTEKGRVIVHHANLGQRDPPERLLRMAESLAALAQFLRRWARADDDVGGWI